MAELWAATLIYLLVFDLLIIGIPATIVARKVRLPGAWAGLVPPFGDIVVLLTCAGARGWRVSVPVMYTGAAFLAPLVPLAFKGDTSNTALNWCVAVVFISRLAVKRYAWTSATGTKGKLFVPSNLLLIFPFAVFIWTISVWFQALRPNRRRHGSVGLGRRRRSGTLSEAQAVLLLLSIGFGFATYMTNSRPGSNSGAVAIGACIGAAFFYCVLNILLEVGKFLVRLVRPKKQAQPMPEDEYLYEGDEVPSPYVRETTVRTDDYEDYPDVSRRSARVRRMPVAPYGVAAPDRQYVADGARREYDPSASRYTIDSGYAAHRRPQKRRILAWVLLPIAAVAIAVGGIVADRLYLNRDREATTAADVQSLPTSTVRLIIIVSFPLDKGAIVRMDSTGTSCNSIGLAGNTGNGIPVTISSDGNVLATSKATKSEFYQSGIAASRTGDVILQVQCKSYLEVEVPRTFKFYSVKVGQEQSQEFSRYELFYDGPISFVLNSE